MFDSTYQITQLPGGQLYVAPTPMYLPWLLTAAIGTLPSYFFVRTILKNKSWFPLWGLLVWTLPLLLVSMVWLRTGSLTLDRTANTAFLHAPSFFWHVDTTIPLDSIHYCDIRTMRASDRIVLVLNNGDALAFADSDQENGKGRAVEAINRYIGSNVR